MSQIFKVPANESVARSADRPATGFRRDFARVAARRVSRADCPGGGRLPSVPGLEAKEGHGRLRDGGRRFGYDNVEVLSAILGPDGHPRRSHVELKVNDKETPVIVEIPFPRTEPS